MRITGGNRGETRSSALWGTGNRGGESRSNALWGKGGRGALTALAAMLAISVPLAASAGSHGRRAHETLVKKTWISPGLLRSANRHPNKYVRVIIQSTTGKVSGAATAFARMDRLDQLGNDREIVDRQLSLVDGIAVTLRADKLAKLMLQPNLIITADAPVHVSGYTSKQLWPYETGLANGWGAGVSQPGAAVPTIAVVDSGIESGRADFGNRVLAERQSGHASGQLSRRRARSRHLRSGHRRGLGRWLRRRHSPGKPRLARRDGRPWGRPDERRDRGLPVDPGEQGQVQHPDRELLAPLGHEEQLHA